MYTKAFCARQYSEILVIKEIGLIKMVQSFMLMTLSFFFRIRSSNIILGPDFVIQMADIWRMKRMCSGLDQLLSLFPLVGNCPFPQLPSRWSAVNFDQWGKRERIWTKQVPSRYLADIHHWDNKFPGLLIFQGRSINITRKIGSFGLCSNNRLGICRGCRKSQRR